MINEIKINKCWKCGALSKETIYFKEMRYGNSLCSSCESKRKNDEEKIRKEAERKYKQEKKECYRCKGQGKFEGWECPDCSGKGYKLVWESGYSWYIDWQMKEKGWKY